MSNEDDNTKTEDLVEEAYKLYVGGIDPALILRIILERGVSPAKAQTVMRWGKSKAEKLGWL